jgi:YHS domain-containing protein
MLRKKLIALMAAAVIGMVMCGAAIAHEGHEHEGAAGPAATTETANNGDLCPVSGDKVDPKAEFTYNYKGKVYRFCCASCLADFKKDPEKYAGKMSGGMAGEAEDHDHGHHDHD